MRRKTKTRWLAWLSSAFAAFGLFGLAACGNTDKEKPQIVFACNDNYLVSVGGYFKIPTDEILVIDDTDMNVNAKYTVTKDGQEIPLNGTKFLAETAGKYVVTVSATDKAGNTEQKTIEVYTSEENEINSFDDEIRINQAWAKGFTEISLNTDPDYIKDGDGSLKLEVKSHNALGWPGVVVQNLPINDILEYYSISFWAYNDGNEDVEIYLNRNDTSAKARFTLGAKMWTKVEVRGRDYDDVFQVQEGTEWGEPECGMCEDIKCFTFHMVRPANSPQFNIYVDSLQVNTQRVYDTLDITADITHPVVGVEYEMPAITAMLGQETVAANVSYQLCDKDFNEIPLTDNKVTLTQAGKYTLFVEAKYDNVTSRKSYMLICANNRADNEIEFFEEETALHFFKSEYMNLSISNEQAQSSFNSSTSSLKIGTSSARWPYLTIGNVPYADLDDVAYIWFYAKTDAVIKDTETPYIGIRNGRMGKVLKRLALTNEWKCFTLTKEELVDTYGITSLEGLQLSIELKDPTNPQADGGWCPITFNTYVDNFTVGKVSEPTQKAESVVLDFANYRDLDNLTSNYVSYNFYNIEQTLNGVGSLKVTASAKWPEITFGSAFSTYALDNVINLVLDVYVPTIAENAYVQIGANNKQYQKILPASAGTWTQIKIPTVALSAAGTNSLSGVKLNLQRISDGATVNLGTLYIGKISLEVDSEAATHVKAANVIYDFYDRKEAEGLTLGTSGAKVIMSDGTRAVKFVNTSGAWSTMKLGAMADTLFNAADVDYVYFVVYVQSPATSETAGETRFTYHYYTAPAADGETGNWDKNTFVKIPLNTWTTVRVPVTTGTPKLADIKVSVQRKPTGGSWQAIGQESGEALFIKEIGVLSNSKAFGDFEGTFESTLDLGIFYSTSADYKILWNENTAYSKSGKSLQLQSQPKWPKYYFTKAFIDWLATAGVKSFSFDVYIAATTDNTISKTEGLVSLNDAFYDSSPTVNAWYTVTISDASKLTTSDYIQFNRNTDSSVINIYIDNMVFTK